MTSALTDAHECRAALKRCEERLTPQERAWVRGGGRECMGEAVADLSLSSEAENAWARGSASHGRCLSWARGSAAAESARARHSCRSFLPIILADPRPWTRRRECMGERSAWVRGGGRECMGERRPQSSAPSPSPPPVSPSRVGSAQSAWAKEDAEGLNPKSWLRPERMGESGRGGAAREHP